MITKLHYCLDNMAPWVLDLHGLALLSCPASLHESLLVVILSSPIGIGETEGEKQRAEDKKKNKGWVAFQPSFKEVVADNLLKYKKKHS